jgi:hypothetical protein
MHRLTLVGRDEKIFLNASQESGVAHAGGEADESGAEA